MERLVLSSVTKLLTVFDDQGRQFDKNGNLVEWWAPETKKAYLEKAQCIIDQYGNYTVPELNINVSYYRILSDR
jgi:predicted metalloendopeptidase